MSSKRLHSLDPVVLKNWRWEPFLEYTVESLSHFNPKPYPLPIDFLSKEGIFLSKSKSQTAITKTWACRTKRLRQVRAACVEASSSASLRTDEAIAA